MLVAGFRKIKVFREVTEAEIDRSGAFIFIEVTNDNASDVDFTVNDFRSQGHSPVSIPIKAGTTRQIPLAVYHFTATAPVTVVAYA